VSLNQLQNKQKPLHQLKTSYEILGVGSGFPFDPAGLFCRFECLVIGKRL
jgi:hypothetical protein